MPASHSWIPQSLDERDVGLEVLNLLLHFHGYFLAGRDLFEMFHTLEDSFEGIVDILFQLFGVDCGQRIIHPAVIPLHPIRGCQPHVFERFKVLDKTTKFVVLQVNSQGVSKTFASYNALFHEEANPTRRRKTIS